MTDPYIHLNVPRGHYIGQVRAYGHQYFRTVTGRCKSIEGAMSRATAKMKGFHRARVLFIDNSGWYDPQICIEAKR